MDQNKKYDIFISYRRRDEQGNISGRDQARLLAIQLEKEGYHTFYDYSEITDNEFDEIIIPAVKSCRVFILVLTKDSLNRCINKGDWVKKEIETAIKSGCKIINVSPDNTFNGWPINLPKSLKRITRINISDINYGQLFAESIRKLIKERISPEIGWPVKNDGLSEFSGAEVHIETDADCDLFRFKTFIQHLTVGDNIIHLSPGKYKFVFVSTEQPEIKSVIKYELFSSLTYDIIEVELKERINLLNEDKQQQEKEEQERQRREGIECYVIVQNGLCGFADEKGDVLIRSKWKDAMPFSEGLAQVIDKEEKCGFINKMGEVVIPCRWKNAGSFSEGLAFVMDDDDQYGFIDKAGNVAVSCQWEQVRDFCEGIALVKNKQGNWGGIDKLGQVVIPCKWKSLGCFREGLALVENTKGKFGFVDKTGRVVIPCIWKGIGGLFVEGFSEGLAQVSNDEGKFGYIDKVGNVAIPCQWNYAGSFSENLAHIVNNQGKIGYIDKAGQVVIPCLWEGILPGDFSEGLVQVSNDKGKYGYIDKVGNVVIPCQWNYAGSFSEGMAYIKNEQGKYGFIDKKGNIVIPCHWEKANAFSRGIARVYDNLDWWLIDKQGNKINKTQDPLRGFFTKFISAFHNT